MEQRATWEASQEIPPPPRRNPKVHYRVRKSQPIPRPSVTFSNKLIFQYELLDPRPTPNLEDYLLSAFRYCLFNIFAATFHIWRTCRPSATWGRAMPWWQGPTIVIFKGTSNNSKLRFVPQYPYHVITNSLFVPITSVGFRIAFSDFKDDTRLEASNITRIRPSVHSFLCGMYNAIKGGSSQCGCNVFVLCRAGWSSQEWAGVGRFWPSTDRFPLFSSSG
jgi:hypothetical protein